MGGYIDYNDRVPDSILGVMQEVLLIRQHLELAHAEKDNMTKRDAYAAMALMGLLSNPAVHPDVHEPEMLSVEAFRYADAMLKAGES